MATADEETLVLLRGMVDRMERLSEILPNVQVGTATQTIDAGPAAGWIRTTVAACMLTATLVLTAGIVTWALWLGLEIRELRARVDYDEQRITVLEQHK